MLSLITLLLLGVALGAMLFFAAVMAPLIFNKLPMETAGGFIRQVFPVYYLALAAVTGFAALSGVFVDRWLGLILLLTAVGFVVAREGLMPRINRQRDAELAGEAHAGARFNRLHQASVILNGAQLVAVLGGFLYLAWPG